MDSEAPAWETKPVNCHSSAFVVVHMLTHSSAFPSVIRMWVCWLREGCTVCPSPPDKGPQVLWLQTVQNLAVEYALGLDQSCLGPRRPSLR